MRRLNPTGTSILPRGRFDGVGEIVRYNWSQYLAAFIGVLSGAVLLAQQPMPTLARWGIGGGLVLTLWWSVASLWVSHWVYDRSHLYDWQWFAELLPFEIKDWLNIHAGLDVGTAGLKRLLPNASGQAVDVFDEWLMTEASIIRARNETRDRTARHASHHALPFGDATFDAVFMIFAAHELRNRDARHRLFGEAARVLQTEGRLVLVEHLRDGWNFLAFGPGYLHFLSRRTWMEAIHAAGLELIEERRMTPFVVALVIRRKS